MRSKLLPHLRRALVAVAVRIKISRDVPFVRVVGAGLFPHRGMLGHHDSLNEHEKCFSLDAPHRERVSELGIRQ